VTRARGDIRSSGAVGNRLRASHPASVCGCRSTRAAAGPRLAALGPVGHDQTAWTWSACGPLAPWLTVYSTF
jgi:hypothetical protein